MQRKIRQKGFAMLLAAFMCMMWSCGKNEFKVSGTLNDAGSRNLTAVYTALSSKTNELVKTTASCKNNQFEFIGVTRYPTLVWLFSSDGNLLHVIYAEKGDDIKVSGLYGSPLEWKITGNKVTEKYSQWMASNVAVLAADNPKQVNDAIAKYVKENPKELASALLLLTLYHRNTDEPGFNKLWKELKISDGDKEDLLHIAMTQLDDARTKAAALTVSPITLRNRKDTTTVVNPADARATILYFWRRTDGDHKGALRLLSSQPSDIQIADVFLDPDTVQWRYNMQNDTVKRRNALWAFGGEMNLGLRRLNIPQTPYFIVTDRKGKQIYRGSSPSDAAASAAETSQ